MKGSPFKNANKSKYKNVLLNIYDYFEKKLANYKERKKIIVLSLDPK